MDKKENFIEKAKSVHGNKYDYSKVEYIDSHTKVCIICPEHGEFWQTPNNHLNNHGCYYCGKGKKDTKEFVKESILVHGDKYSYDKSEYVSANKKIIVTCKKHGDFLIRASSHLSGCGCKKCAAELSAASQRKSKEKFIQEAKAVHGNKYDYSKVEYINTNTKVCIICPEHGEFWQTPTAHIKLYEGCPNCKNSRMCDFLKNKLQENNINFEAEKTFEWLKHKNNMYLDFFLPDYNIGIECQGGQHFVPVKKYNGKEGLKIRTERDFKKKSQCEENGIKIIYIIPKMYKNFINKAIYSEKNSLIFEDENLFENIQSKIIEKNIL